jgi:hypothetical protein
MPQDVADLAWFVPIAAITISAVTFFRIYTQNQPERDFILGRQLHNQICDLARDTFLTSDSTADPTIPG